MLIPLPACSDHQTATRTVEARPAVSMKKTGRFFSEYPDWANSKLLKIFTFGFSKEMVMANSFSVKLRVKTPCICNGFNQLSRDSFLSMSKQSRTTLPLGKPFHERQMKTIWGKPEILQTEENFKNKTIFSER